LAFFAFFAFFAFLAMVFILSGLMDGNATPRHARRRASLATSSPPIEQIRGALPRSVTSLSSRYPQLICIFALFCRFSRVMRRRKARIAVFVQENFRRPSRRMDHRIESGDDILRVDRNRNAA
jgi:hypothetical protein